MMTINFGGIVIPGEPTASTGWWFSDLDDWYGLSDDKNRTEERPQAHGAFGVTRSLRQSVAISFKCYFHGSAEAALAAQSQLVAVGATEPIEMSVTDADGTSSRIVTVRNVTPRDRSNRNVIAFSVDVVARDPRRYTAPQVDTTGLPVAGGGLESPLLSPVKQLGGGTTGRLNITNAGTASSSPVFTVRGGLGAFNLIEVTSGRRIAFGRPLATSDTVTIDMNSRRATLNGEADVTSFLTARDWWSMEPGTTSTVQFTGTDPVGSPSLEGRVRGASW